MLQAVAFLKSPNNRDSQVVTVLAFYSDNPISNPTEVYSFHYVVCKLFKKNENKQKEVGYGPF